ncbi:MAG: 3-isopropylmalate dehydratase small subunit [Planctomycetaceae bacterium]|nr:3-isopropylmalate dehydratase small subunit [Planctomycetaceae bacterium]
MQQITTVSGTAIPLLLDDIDTDRIIPARYLRCVTFEGLGDHAFEDDRQQDPAHSFNQPQHAGASILVSGRNFGCGSSREHAPQSLMRWGIKAVVAESFAEIFFGNCTGLGIPCVTAARADLAKAASAIAENPAVPVTLDLTNLTLSYGDFSIPVSMPKSPHEALTSGQWDFLGQLLDNQPAIRDRAQAIPYLSGFQA